MPKPHPFQAAYHGTLEDLEASIAKLRSMRKNVDTNVTKAGASALVNTSAFGRTEHVARLLRAGANPNGVGAMSLWFATQNGKTDTALLLLRYGADRNETSPWEGTTPVEAARAKGHEVTANAVESFRAADHPPPEYDEDAAPCSGPTTKSGGGGDTGSGAGAGAGATASQTSSRGKAAKAKAGAKAAPAKVKGAAKTTKAAKAAPTGAAKTSKTKAKAKGAARSAKRARKGD